MMRAYWRKGNATMDVLLENENAYSAQAEYVIQSRYQFSRRIYLKKTAVLTPVPVHRTTVLSGVAGKDEPIGEGGKR